ncbi:MAG TPA: D-Ala-D-Ala carboxypeptidase family metallohydrolase [Gemmatimonadaceae bacterium]|nr:D-Ala-D-Ala carboxypeptidase family metallohydrolase [Gemmatimonadaceae bacterium]
MSAPHGTGTRLGGIGAALFFGLATIGAVQFLRPEAQLTSTPLSNLADAVASTVDAGPSASPTADAFGVSGEVKVRLSLPGGRVEFPIAIAGTGDSLAYQWVSAVDQSMPDPARTLTAAPTIAPHRPGFYHLSVLRGETREILSEPTLVVMVPFDRKLGGRVNGYRIGTYLAERFGGRYDHPLGFIEVRPEMLDLAVTKHLKLGDFVTHDDQGDVWPKYVALDPRLLDKLELVFTDLGSRLRPGLGVDMHSGFRTPSHNAHVERAARDSRHQYGDAADLAIDADGDGRITMTDELLVMLAVERVEDAHPDLAGGLGLYTSRRYRTPYVHIDARGKRSRWQG